MYCFIILVHFCNPPHFLPFLSIHSYNSFSSIPIVKNRNAIIFQFARGIIASLISCLLASKWIISPISMLAVRAIVPAPRNSRGCKLDFVSLSLSLSLSLYFYLFLFFFFSVSLATTREALKSLERTRELDCCPFPRPVARLIVQKPAIGRRESSELESGSKRPELGWKA